MHPTFEAEALSVLLSGPDGGTVDSTSGAKYRTGLEYRGNGF